MTKKKLSVRGGKRGKIVQNPPPDAAPDASARREKNPGPSERHTAREVDTKPSITWAIFVLLHFQRI